MHFRFQPSEIMEFTKGDFEFWMERLKEQEKAQKKQLGKG